MRIAQVAQAVEPRAWRKPPVKLCFGGRIGPRAGGRNAARKRGILECGDVLGHARSITTLCGDV